MKQLGAQANAKNRADTGAQPRVRPFQALAQEVVDRCQHLARFSEDPQSIRRTFLSPPMHEVHRDLTEWLRALGAEVQIDAAGNLHGFIAGMQSDSPRLLIGSHLDTVPNAGAYDGVLGVVIAVALMRAMEMKNEKVKLPFGIEVVGFSEEEGVRFGEPFIGSRALVGRLDEQLFNRRDESGVSVRDAIRNFGLQPEKMAEATAHPETLAYLEFHIEQGPVLDNLGLPLAAVEGIAGQTRLEITFVGKSNHAGTTPMDFRRDAIAAAAEWITAVEHSARETSGLVATVGKLEAKPGATNVIAGEARLTLDVRSGSNEVRARAVKDLIEKAEQIAKRRGLSTRRSVLLDQSTVVMGAFLVNQIEAAIRQTGCEPHRMMSGAGHDAMILAEKVPSAMIFLRTPGGISHDPDESVAVDDVEKAIECGVHLLNQLANAPEFLKRT